MSDTSPRSAYLHVPFCVHRCGYCNFTVVADRGDLVENYLQAIAMELSWLGQPRPVETLYFGGGTPTYLAPAELDRLCRTVLEWHPLLADYEWTVEANPADLDAERLAVLVAHGVNRISLGAQSFQERKLQVLERDHTADDIQRSVALCRDQEMRVSLDVIFGVPGETVTEWHADLEQLIRLAPQHVSTYGLTFERGTSFWSRLERCHLRQLPEALEREMYLAAIARLVSTGYEHYEVSNFALPGARSRHNEAYWSGSEYYAAGPGAARYVDGARQTNHRSTTTYLKRVLAGQSPVAEEERLLPDQRAREALVFGLRRMEGVNRGAFHALTGAEIDQLAGEQIRQFVDLGLLADDGLAVRLTREGLLVSDSLWPDLL